MIVFPHFQPISIDSRSEIDFYTKGLRPYSDFNFCNLQVWNFNNLRKYSILNNNLIILFSDYRTNYLHLSFVGETDLDKTAETLLEYAKAHNLAEKLYFVPEEIASNINSTNLLVAEDPSNHDYVFSIHDIANGSKRLKTKNRLATKFITENPTAIFSTFDLNNQSNQRELLSLYDTWTTNRQRTINNYDATNERLALIQTMSMPGPARFVASWIRIGSRIVAFSIDELLSDGYVLSHFIKADINYKGIYEFINQQVAILLEVSGCEFWNWEQDLNLPGLKRMKESYRPIFKLKKFTISFQLTYKT